MAELIQGLLKLGKIMLTHGIYLLDTDTCIALIKKHPNVRKHISNINPLDCKISEITHAELLFGAVKSGQERHFNDVIYVTTMFEEFRIGSCLRKYADIRWLLESQGQRIDSLDLLIAATALHYNLILVTGNEKHFNRIPNLKIENWIKN